MKTFRCPLLVRRIERIAAIFLQLIGGVMICSGAPTALQPGLAGPKGSLVFMAADKNGFTFNTGLLRGKLRPDGKSLGLISVIHSPSGTRLDRSNGLLSHYRVFTKGVRYGAGAWDWPSKAILRGDGAVEVRWASAAGRPFSMRAIYRWSGPGTLDLETIVRAERKLEGFESFLACYYSAAFTNAAVYVAGSTEYNHQIGFLPARAVYGQWQMFPRDASALNLISDGRWNLEPHPVQWTAMPTLAKPIAWRRDVTSGLMAVAMSPPTDCFAIATPHQMEGHYSVYLSLFGRDLEVAETARARVRLVVTSTRSDQEILELYQDYLGAIH